MRTFNKPDLNAPRFRRKHINPLTKDLWERFKKKYPEHGEIPLAKFKEIIRVYNGLVWQGVIDNRDGVELPEGLGFICMATCPRPQTVNPDMAKSIELGKVINHKNWDSDNKLLKIFYTNYAAKYRFQNFQVWGFRAVKQFRKAASDAYKENWPMYMLAEPGKKISANIVRSHRNHFLSTKAKEVSEEYDEFNMD